MDGFKMPAGLEEMLSQQDMLRGGPMTSAGASMMPTPRSQAEIDALRSGDQMQASQMAKQMYRQAHPQSTGLIGMGQDIYRSFGKDEKMQGYQEQALEGLTQARTAEDLGANRTRQDEVNEILQGQGFESGESLLTRAGQNERAANTITSQEGVAANTLEGQNTRAANTITAADDRQDDQQGFLAGSVPAVPYHDGNGGVVNVKRDPNTGATYTVGADGSQTPIDTTGLTPYSASQTEGSTALRGQVARTDQNMESRLSQIDDDVAASTIGRILQSSVFEAGTGRFDARRYAGMYLGAGEQGRAIQSLNLDMNGIQTTGLAPMLDMMGVNPTDKDMEQALKTQVSAGDQPQAWIDYLRNKFAPRALEVALMRIGQGQSDKTPEEVQGVYDSLMRMADESEARIYGDGGKPADELGDFDAAAPGIPSDKMNKTQRDARIAYLQSL